MADIDNNQIICPISLEPIKVAGITSNGGIYSYENITEWLKENISDPITNLPLPTTFVVKWTNLENVNEQAKHIKQTTSIWCQYYVSPELLKRYNDQINKLKVQYNEVNKTNAWRDFQKDIDERSELSIDIMKEAFYNYATGRESSYRFVTGNDMQFVSLTNRIFYNLNIKSVRFDMCNFSNCVFRNCVFSRCSFLGSTLNNITFIDCTFSGEEFTMYKATGRLNLINCKMESYNWKNTSNVDKIKFLMKNERQFEGDLYVYGL